MSKKWTQIALIVFGMAFLVAESRAQSADDVLRYGLQYPSYDPVSVVMPGVSQATGFGAFQENPASMALFDDGYMSFSLSSRTVSEEGTYLGNSMKFDDSQTAVGDLGFVYKVPTIRGSLAIGGGYSQTTDFNRALAVGGRNNESTITDYYASFPIDDSLNVAAYRAYAIEDSVMASGELTSVSIFRFLPESMSYPGIDQDMEMTERGALGEYSAFIATEVQQGLMIGASIGLLAGTYSYERFFLETDGNNDYEGAFIDSDNDGAADTDIDNILSEDFITADITAFSARLGFVYQVLPAFSIGGSYQFKNKLYIEETYDTYITTTFDNGRDASGDDLGRYSYQITRPSRLNLGFTAKNLAGFTLSVAGEAVQYSQGRLEFDEIQLREAENAVNRTVRSNFEDVVNIRAGLEFEAIPLFSPRVGYAYFPSPQENFDSGRQFYSGGFSTQLFDNLTFDLGVQYATWEDRNELYTYEEGGELVGEVAGEEVSRWHVMAGLKIGI